MDNYLQYIGGSTGAIVLTGIAAASALYFATRPTPEKPLVPLHEQSPVLEVSHRFMQIEFTAVRTHGTSAVSRINARTSIKVFVTK